MAERKQKAKEQISTSAALLARNIRRLLQFRDMKQGELAERAGLTDATVSRLVNAQVNYTPENVEKLAAAFGVPVVELFLEHVDVGEAELVEAYRTLPRHDRSQLLKIARAIAGPSAEAAVQQRVDAEKDRIARALVKVVKGSSS